MSLFENFPYTNLHELNLDWLINAIKDLQENMVISVNGQTGEVVLYQDATVSFPDVSEDHWSIVRSSDGTARGIMFGNDNKAYILHDSVMNEVYAANNPPPYPVTSVNGQTGAITLYSDRVVRLPDLNDAEIHSWNIFRNMNSVSSGIEFDEAGDAYIILGTQRYKLYSTKNASTVVTSVNGETGEVDLFTDTDGEVAFPAFVDPDYDGWMIRRDVNDDRIGLLLKQDGTLSLIINDALYTVYNSNDPQPDWVNDPTANMIQVTAPATGSMWGFIRNTTTAPVGVLLFILHLDFFSAIPIPYLQDKIDKYRFLTEAGVFEELSLKNPFIWIQYFIIIYSLYFYDTIIEFCPSLPLLLKISAYSMVCFFAFSSISVVASRLHDLLGVVELALFPCVIYTIRPDYYGKAVVCLIGIIEFVFTLFIWDLLDFKMA